MVWHGDDGLAWQRWFVMVTVVWPGGSGLAWQRWVGLAMGLLCDRRWVCNHNYVIRFPLVIWELRAKFFSNSILDQSPMFVGPFRCSNWSRVIKLSRLFRKSLNDPVDCVAMVLTGLHSQPYFTVHRPLADLHPSTVLIELQHSRDPRLVHWLPVCICRVVDTCNDLNGLFNRIVPAVPLEAVYPTHARRPPDGIRRCWPVFALRSLTSFSDERLTEELGQQQPRWSRREMGKEEEAWKGTVSGNTHRFDPDDHVTRICSGPPVSESIETVNYRRMSERRAFYFEACSRGVPVWQPSLLPPPNRSDPFAHAAVAAVGMNPPPRQPQQPSRGGSMQSVGVKWPVLMRILNTLGRDKNPDQ